MEPVSLEPPGSTLKDPKSAPILSLSKKGLRSHPCAGVMLKAQVPTLTIKALTLALLARTEGSPRPKQFSVRCVKALGFGVAGFE